MTDDQGPVVTPNGRLCSSRCPQWAERYGGIGKCRLLGYEVRAEPDAWTVENARQLGYEPMEAEACPVVAIRSAHVEPVAMIRCGMCGGAVHYFMSSDVAQCETCGAAADGPAVRYGDLSKVKWER